VTSITHWLLEVGVGDWVSFLQNVVKAAAYMHLLANAFAFQKWYVAEYEVVDSNVC
jgi:hypothetical protein